MNEFELRQLLESAHAPDRSPDYWERFPEEVTRRLRGGAGVRRESRSSLSLRARAALGLATATACIAIAVSVGVWNGRRDSHEGGSIAVSLKLIQEISALFPSRVRAVISDESGVRLVLSDRADVPHGIPLVVRACRGRNCTSIITFSGQEIEIAGSTFEVLLNADGDVLWWVWIISGRARAGPRHLME